MKINITEKARELYGQYCSISTAKCESFEELDYKIQRCIDLGQKRCLSDGTYLVQYYRNQFHIKDGEIINMSRSKKCHLIKEKRKINHYYNTYKVMV